MARKRLLSMTVPAAGTTTYTAAVPSGGQYLAFYAKFDYGSGGTTCKAYVQTSLDGGTTFDDVACFAFALAGANKRSKVTLGGSLTAGSAPADGALADNTVQDGLFGDQWRIKLVVVGTYASSTIEIWAQGR